MPAIILEIADAIVAELQAIGFVPPFSVARHYLPRFELSEMNTLRVSVVPRSVRSEALDRQRDRFDYQIDVAVQQKIEPANAHLDALMNRVEEIADHFRAKRLASYPNAAWLKTEQSVLYAPEHIDELRQFTSVLTLTYRVLR